MERWKEKLVSLRGLVAREVKWILGSRVPMEGAAAKTIVEIDAKMPEMLQKQPFHINIRKTAPIYGVGHVVSPHILGLSNIMSICFCNFLELSERWKQKYI